jgi:glycogen debranching enzyme
MLVRANQCLREISNVTGFDLSPDLLNCMKQTEEALEQLWDESKGQYFSRSFVSHKLIEEPSIGTLIPLYAGTIPKERAARLVELLKKQRVFSPSWPVPSVPLNSPDFNPLKYWQGPTWVNTNWLIIDGLERCGYKGEAQVLRDRTVQLVAKSGMYEYFSPLNAEPAGAANFSWTAALTIDLLNN